MSKHIYHFANLKDEDVPNPKDKITFEFKDKRKDKYRIVNGRFICRTDK